MTENITGLPEHAAAPVETLLEIVRRYGTPTYAYDLDRLRTQVNRLRGLMPNETEILYSLKANASLGISDVFAATRIGADVASAGELAIAVEAGFPPDRIFVAGPFKSTETVQQLLALPAAVVSVDSPSELHWLSQQKVRNRIVLRLRPDFGSFAVVTAGRECRFGFTLADLRRMHDDRASHDGDIVGFHVFAGSQVLDAEKAIAHLNAAFEMSLRAADLLGITPSLFNLGGGFGIPYSSDDRELQLGPIADALEEIGRRARPARIVLELGRYLVAQAGWYLTSVLGFQDHQGRHAVVVDGGTHQRADMCGLCLRSKAKPPVALAVPDAPANVTDVLGCLSLPADVLSEACLLPALAASNVLAYPNAGAYGLWASPALFHALPMPAEVAFDGETIHLMRPRRPAADVLENQRHVPIGGPRGTAAKPATHLTYSL